MARQTLKQTNTQTCYDGAGQKAVWNDLKSCILKTGADKLLADIGQNWPNGGHLKNKFGITRIVNDHSKTFLNISKIFEN